MTASSDAIVRIHRAVHQLPVMSDWEPSQPEAPWLAYWGDTLCVVRDELTARGVGCDIVLTQKPDALPWAGDRTVAVMYGDIVGQPGWAHTVAITYQALGRDGRMAPSATSVRISGLRAALVGWALTLRARRREAKRIGPARRVELRDAPLGTYNMVDVPLDPIGEREIDVAFDGSVSHWTGWWGSFQRRMMAPKVHHRELMVAALQRFADDHPEARIRLKLRDQFVQVGEADGAGDSPEAYSRRLASAKIVICPPGTLPLTFRHFEALRAGCVPVVLDAPDTDFLAGAPLVSVSRWDDLPRVLGELLASPARLERLGAEARRFWDERLAPAKVGARLAAEIAEALGTSPVTAGGVAR